MQQSKFYYSDIDNDVLDDYTYNVPWHSSTFRVHTQAKYIKVYIYCRIQDCKHHDINAGENIYLLNHEDFFPKTNELWTDTWTKTGEKKSKTTP